MSTTAFVQHGKIKCPACLQERDHLAVWRNIDGVPFCACDGCIQALDADLKVGDQPAITTLLRIGFHEGSRSAMRKMSKAMSEISHDMTPR